MPFFPCQGQLMELRTRNQKHCNLKMKKKKRKIKREKKTQIKLNRFTRVNHTIKNLKSFFKNKSNNLTQAE